MKKRENSDNADIVERDVKSVATCKVCRKKYKASALEIKRQQEGLEESLCAYHQGCKDGDHGDIDDKNYPPEPIFDEYEEEKLREGGY